MLGLVDGLQLTEELTGTSAEEKGSLLSWRKGDGHLSSSLTLG